MMNESYRVKYIKTKNKYRKIITYNSEEIKREHIFINDKINNHFKPSIFTKGYVKNESIYTNSLAHLYNDYFIKTDIKDFFNSINHKLLRKKIYYELKEIISPIDCDILVKKCTISKKGLPLGLITSPTLSNIYLKSFDKKLYRKLRRLNCKNIIYTRYADDIIISFKECDNIEEKYLEIIEIINRLLKEYHLKLNNKKTKFIDFKKTKQVRITGVSIVEKNGLRKLSIGRNNKRKLFYDAINFKKNLNNKYDKLEAQKLKGKLSFYLSIERYNFENFITSNMKKELIELGYNNFISFMRDL